MGPVSQPAYPLPPPPPGCSVWFFSCIPSPFFPPASLCTFHAEIAHSAAPIVIYIARAAILIPSLGAISLYTATHPNPASTNWDSEAAVSHSLGCFVHISAGRQRLCPGCVYVVWGPGFRAALRTGRSRALKSICLPRLAPDPQATCQGPQLQGDRIRAQSQGLAAWCLTINIVKV